MCPMHFHTHAQVPRVRINLPFDMNYLADMRGLPRDIFALEGVDELLKRHMNALETVAALQKHVSSLEGPLLPPPPPPTPSP